MANPHPVAPHLSTYAAKARRRAEDAQPQPQLLTECYFQKFTPADLIELGEAERAHQHLGKVTSWKQNFKSGTIFEVKGVCFKVMAITRRGLVVHRIRPTTGN